jgi:hypothetical protein
VALTLAPDEPGLHADLADTLADAGLLARARESYLAAWALQPLLWAHAKERAEELEEEEAELRRTGRAAAQEAAGARLLAEADALAHSV